MMETPGSWEFPLLPILVVEKNKPEWQKGRLNLPGGKIEDGEDPPHAALREFFEEVGPSPCSAMPQVMGVIQGSWGKVYCCRWLGDPSSEIKPQDNETEKVFWAPWNEIKDDPRLIPNLRVVIPMMLMNCKDWNIYDSGPSWGSDVHSFDIEVKNGWPVKDGS